MPQNDKLFMIFGNHIAIIIIWATTDAQGRELGGIPNKLVGREAGGSPPVIP